MWARLPRSHSTKTAGRAQIDSSTCTKNEVYRWRRGRPKKKGGGGKEGRKNACAVAGGLHIKGRNNSSAWKILGDTVFTFSLCLARAIGAGEPDNRLLYNTRRLHGTGRAGKRAGRQAGHAPSPMTSKKTHTQLHRSASGARKASPTSTQRYASGSRLPFTTHGPSPPFPSLPFPRLPRSFSSSYLSSPPVPPPLSSPPQLSPPTDTTPATGAITATAAITTPHHHYHPP